MSKQFHGLLPDHSRLALVVLDMFSTFQFPDAAGVLRAARRIAPRIAALKDRCRRAGVACIYVNDNAGRWRSNSGALIEACEAPDSPGADIVHTLRPMESDYIVLKPRHSAFFATPFEVLLEHLGTERLILTGVSSHQCVLFTANDAHLRGLELIVPSDCVGAPAVRDERFALQYFSRVLGARVVGSNHLHPGALNRKSSRRIAGDAS
jgi:nicotinamidase-related amidase